MILCRVYLEYRVFDDKYDVRRMHVDWVSLNKIDPLPFCKPRNFSVINFSVIENDHAQRSF